MIFEYDKVPKDRYPEAKRYPLTEPSMTPFTKYRCRNG